MKSSHAGDFGCVVRIGKQLSDTADKTDAIFFNQNLVKFSFHVTTPQQDFI